MSGRPCYVCGETIGAERAEALPDTVLCIEHAREAEKYGGEFVMSGTMEKTSKAGSLKQSYGGITPTRMVNLTALKKVKEAFDERTK